MGGKTKQAPRTKNNARPSNSGRSAELLGSTASSFVGFTSHSDLGMVAFVPGFSTFESLPETFDSNIKPEYQLTLRKLTKKDPVTKVKALQELNGQILESELEDIKSILPLWPKFFLNLSNDVEHRVREATQTVHSTITTKCGKLLAPFIKQLAPIWIASRFDIYAPAGSLALSSFKSSFPPHKIKEVFVYCQNEIIDYIIKNLTFHTPSTLSNMKTITNEDAENKYQRIIISSMKTLALFFEITSSTSALEIDEKCQNLLQHQKLWSFSKHKVVNVRSAFFEFLCSVLQNTPRHIELNKNQVMQVCFQNIDDLDPLTAPHIWGCVLLIQATFSDWHEKISYKKVIQPKFTNIFKTISGGSSSIARNFLPFICNLSESKITDLHLHEFYADFFKNMKQIIQKSQTTSYSSKANISSLINAYFECLRYVFKHLSNHSETTLSVKEISQEYLQKYVIDLLEWSLEIDNVFIKNIYKQCSALIAYWSSNSNNECYTNLLSTFWSSFVSIVTKTVSANQIDDIHIRNVVELIKHLYNSSPALHENKVKFCDKNEQLTKIENKEINLKCSNFVAKDLKENVIHIVKTYIEKALNIDPNKYATQIKTLCQMFGDSDFYTRLSSDGCLITLLSTFIRSFDNNETPSEEILDIVFDIISLLDKNKKMEQILEILKTKNSKVQFWTLIRILSYPLCLEPGIRNILEEKKVEDLILTISKQAVNENSTEKFNLLHKCFFQNDSGQILINKNVVEGILNTILEPLLTAEKESMIDTCGSFIAQMMPVICIENNSTKEFKNKIFLELFKFSVNSTVSENLSEDSLWEIKSAWQDSLSCKDIILIETLLVECKTIVEKKLNESNTLSLEELDNISDTIARLIQCSKQKGDEEDNSSEYKSVDHKINLLLAHSELDNRNVVYFENICKFYEALQKVKTVDVIENEYSKNISIDKLRKFYQKVYYSFSVIFNLCYINNEDKHDNNSEMNDVSQNEEEIMAKLDWKPKLCELITYNAALNAIGESLIKNSSMINEEVETIIFSLSEKIKNMLETASDSNLNMIKDIMINKAFTGDIFWLRSLPYLLSAKCYKECKENGPILLIEEISDQLLSNGQYDIYNNLIETFLTDLTPRSLPLYENILKCDNIKVVSSFLKNLLYNHLSTTNFSKIEDKNLVTCCIKFVTETGDKQIFNQESFLYNQNISTKEFGEVSAVVQYINLLSEILERFPVELNIKNWDSIRIGMCSWVLSISNSIEKYSESKVVLFIVSVYGLFSSLSKFIKAEKSKSSTKFHIDVIDEWENVFSKEVNLVLFKNYHSLVTAIENCNNEHLTFMLDKIASCVTYLDYKIIYFACENGFKLNVNDLLDFALVNMENLSGLRKTSTNIIKNISINLVKKDFEKFERHNETFKSLENSGEDWHFLTRFENSLKKYEQSLQKYIDEFSYKLSEIQEFKKIDRNLALRYLRLWDCIIYTFSKSPNELKSLYASWIANKKFENNLLNFIFRAMPLEILKNHDQKSLNNDVFKFNLWESQFQDETLSIEKCACYMYTQILRYLPVIVRKWWNGTQPRQKNFIDKLTTNFVSNLIWIEDLSAIHKTDKQENMQISVHQSTREVIAVYSIDEARMELIITLPQNHPLGVIKVEMGKQIGGKSTSRNIGMQLTIFLTHQNGSIFDGLLLWKKNLDKKFAGVEECYVCYTVIHQDTCQLPKLTCKTCKKKFHGPCLYKWFTTSSKSTCPLCRNVF